MNDLWTDLALNLLAEAVGIAATIFLIDRIIRRREKLRIAPVKEALLSRINKHCRFLAFWVESMAFEETKVASELISRIEISKEALLESIDLGDALLSPDIRRIVLELDARLDSLTNAASIREYFPNEEWVTGVDETLLQLKILFDLLGNDQDSMLLECWLEVFHERPNARATSTRTKKPKRKKKTNRKPRRKEH